MKLIVCSLQDKASINIRNSIFSSYRWSYEGEFDDNEVYSNGENLLVSINELHLNADNIEKDISEKMGYEVAEIIFLSRHKAASGIHTLTVHPIGNYLTAEYGGLDRTLVPAMPRRMTQMLREMKRLASNLDFEVSFEVTHHGPYATRPTCFIEIGSDQSMWDNLEAAGVIAKSVMIAEVSDDPVAIGIGGGHYAPRFSEVALTKKISFGHMIPSYVLEKLDDEGIERTLRMAAENTPNVRYAYIHRKAMKRSDVTKMLSLLAKIGLEIVDSQSPP